MVLSRGRAWAGPKLGDHVTEAAQYIEVGCRTDQREPERTASSALFVDYSMYLAYREASPTAKDNKKHVAPRPCSRFASRRRAATDCP